MSGYTFSSYYLDTGLFDGAHFTGHPMHLAAQIAVKPNVGYVMGEYDHLTQKVDLESGLVVDYQPPSPGARHVWNAEKKRWAYVPSDAEALWDAQQAAMAHVNDFYAARLSWIRATYPNDEVTSWAKQENEARAWTANPTTPTPLLSAIAEARGVPFALLVEKVIEKADLFAAASGQLIGARQQAEDRVNAATTPADVEQVISEIFPAE